VRRFSSYKLIKELNFRQPIQEFALAASQKKKDISTETNPG
jgi:hypothetical protein